MFVGNQLSKMTTVCWNGCSFTVGEGFDIGQREKYIYRCLVDQHFGFESALRATSGASNYKIFIESAKAVLSKKYHIVFTQWSALNRIWLYPGPDTEFFLNDEAHVDYSYKDLYISSSDKKKLQSQLLILNHDYHNIIDLIQYCNILESLSSQAKTKVVFINGLVPWTDDIVIPINKNDLEKSLSKYTKSILDFSHRDDHEIVKFFEHLQKEFAMLNQSLWVNLFDSMFASKIDTGPQGHHPGVKSHYGMYKKIVAYLEGNI